MSLRVRYQWTTPLRECLATSVGKREKLWKKFPVVSHDLELRATLWGEVAQEIKERFGIVVDTDDMKKTWKNLKDNYLRMRKMYDSEPEKAQKWHFFDAMRFMDRAGIDESATDGKMVTANDTSSRQTVRLKPVVMEGRIEFQPDVKEVVISNGPSIIHRKTQNRQRSHSKTMVIQVGFPEIDRLIITKQLPPNQLLRLPVDPNASELEQHLIDVWHKVETDERDMDIIVLDESYDDTPSSFTTDLSDIHTKTLEVEPSTSNGICSQSTCTYTEASGLKDLENYGTKLDESAKLFISSNVQKMRGLFHKTALECFISQNMPQGQLNNLLQAFDDHVFHKKPCSPLIDKVLSTCTQEIRDAFYNLFTILSRYRDQLSIRCPVERWAKVDAEAKKNIDNVFNRKAKRKYVRMVQLEPRDRVRRDELRLIQNHKNTLNTRIEELSKLVATTAAKLKCSTEENDKPMKKELENTLRLAKQALQEKRNEQREATIAYVDLLQKFEDEETSKSAKLYKLSDEHMEMYNTPPLSYTTSELPSTLIEDPNTAHATELFQNTIKEEPI